MQQKWNQNFDGEPMTDIPQKFLNAGCDVYMVMRLRHDEKILDERFASMRELNRRGKMPDPEHYEVTYYADSVSYTHLRLIVERHYIGNVPMNTLFQRLAEEEIRKQRFSKRGLSRQKFCRR